MFSFMEIYTNAKNYNINVIVGVDISFCDKNLTLYAKNYNGYENRQEYFHACLDIKLMKF